MIAVWLLVSHQLNTSYVEVFAAEERLRLVIDIDPHDTPVPRDKLDAFVFDDVQPSCVRKDTKTSFDAQLKLWHGEAHYACAKPVKELALYLAYLDKLPREHRALVRVTLDGKLGPQTTLRHGQAILDFRDENTAWRFFVMGAEHIASGADHLAFILALLLGAVTLRRAVIALTAFTIAHSLTLALAWLHVFSLSPHIVEPLIALSIVAVCAENKSSAWLAFAFGLMHGMGFATALDDAHFAKDALAVSLLCFNLGVEATQIALVVVAWPIIKRLGAYKPALRVALACVGLVWAVQRVL